MSDKRSQVSTAVRAASVVGDSDLPRFSPTVTTRLARETMATLCAPADPDPDSGGVERVRPLPPAALRRPRSPTGGLVARNLGRGAVHGLYT